MIQNVIPYINDQIDLLNHFAELKELCEIIKDKKEDVDITFPAEYCTTGEYKQIDFDFKKGVLYHRLTGDITETETGEKLSGCDQQLERTYPLKLVFVVAKSLLNTDDKYIDLKVLENIKVNITKANVKSLAQTLRLDIVEIKPTSWTNNREDIIAEEYSGIDFQIDYDKIYGRINYNIILTGSRNCFENFECND